MPPTGREGTIVSRINASKSGFTLTELLVVLGVIAILSALVFPALGKALAAGRSAACQSNLHQMQVAYQMYLDDHNGRFFPWSTNTTEGTLWYFGLEPKGGSSGEGSRTLDKSRARLAPYFTHCGGIEVCPSLPYKASYFKQKFELASYGYGLNAYLIAGTSQNKNSGITRISQVDLPAETIAWADAIQVNEFQAPASPKNPLLEEWYCLTKGSPPTFHFRHNKKCNAIMVDGSSRSFEPYELFARCDGLSGWIEPKAEDYYLRPVK